ncbi:MAG: Fic family protein [Bacteroidaceae bacterium]|nr:Fic family protein [Bacteroidaceae bacterium]
MKEELKKRFLAALKEYHSLGIAEQIDYQKFYLYSIITHSTAIEGSTVTEIENQLLFDEGITAKGRSLQEQMMNLDLKAAYEHSMQLAHQHTDFSIDMLKELSAIVMKNTGASYNTAQGSFDASKGDLRLVGVTAGIGGRSYMNYQKVPAKLAELCQLLNQRRQTLLNGTDIIEQYLLSFDAHYQLVTIHPWVDGNGRMSRLVMNHLQYEFGLVPVKIVKEDKAEYIQALVDSREQESLEPFREFMMEEHVRNICKEIEEYKKSQADDPIKVTSDPIKSFSDPIKDRLYQAVLQDGTLNYAEYAAIVGASEATVKRRLGELKKEGIIIRVGSNKTGHWEVVNRS